MNVSVACIWIGREKVKKKVEKKNGKRTFSMQCNTVQYSTVTVQYVTHLGPLIWY